MFWSNAFTKVLTASLTAAHLGPIELETSSTRDRSTILRVASPELPTVTSWKLASCMNVVGSVADAFTVTTLSPLAGIVVRLKKFGSEAGSVTADVPR